MRGSLRAFCVVAGAAMACQGVGAEEPTLAWMRVVEPRLLPAGTTTVAFGGCSDLAINARGTGTMSLWTITDRGPNGTATGPGNVKRRTLLAPAFTPCIARITVAPDGDTPSAAVDQIIPLVGASGRALTGRPNGVAPDEPMLEADGVTLLAPSPDGIDTEGLVAVADGFWACEEYRPSLLRLSRDGRVRERHVPEGTRLADADTVVIDDLPAAYASRRDNRGFEAIALSLDGTRLYVCLQSPLDLPHSGVGAETGNVRLLVADADTGRSVAEHVYRLGDPATHGSGRLDGPSADGKLCAMAVSADGEMFVLEQAEGLAHVYRVDLASATNTLGRLGEPIEAIRDLAGAGIEAIHKELAGDLGPLLPAMRRDVFGDASAGTLKLEGMVVLDDRRFVFVNDNDFGVHRRSGEQSARTCLWCVVFPTPARSHAAVTGHP